MKLGIILFFILLSSVFVSARSINLLVGSSYTIEDKNVTLMRVYESKALICVNSVKSIVEEDKIRKVNSVNIELRSTNGNIAAFDFEYSCKGDCVCGKDCENISCDKESEEEAVEENIEDTEGIIEENQANPALEKKEVVNSEGIGLSGVIGAVLAVVVLFLGVILLWKRF